jgi:hypothetical protein
MVVINENFGGKKSPKISISAPLVAQGANFLATTKSYGGTASSSSSTSDFSASPAQVEVVRRKIFEISLLSAIPIPFERHDLIAFPYILKCVMSPQQIFTFSNTFNCSAVPEYSLIIPVILSHIFRSCSEVILTSPAATQCFTF